MAELNIPRNYQNGSPLVIADLDGIIDTVETLVNSTGLSEDNFQTNVVSASKLIDNTAAEASFASSSVTGAKIPASNITTAKLATSSVDSSHIVSNAITTAKIADNAVATAKIADRAVTADKLAAADVNESSFSSSAMSPGNSATWVLADSLTTSGRPVFLMLMSNESTDDSYAGTTGGDQQTYLKLKIEIYDESLTLLGHAGESSMIFYATATSGDAGLSIPPSAFCWVDLITLGNPGTYTYKAVIENPVAGDTIVRIRYTKLVAFEL